jgi:hypothetical protein
MTDENASLSETMRQNLARIGEKVNEMKARARTGETDLRGDVQELDRLVRELKAMHGLSAFDKTAYQREYMRKKRAEDPDYRPIMRGVRDVPDWRSRCDTLRKRSNPGKNNSHDE